MIWKAEKTSSTQQKRESLAFHDNKGTNHRMIAITGATDFGIVSRNTA